MWLILPLAARLAELLFSTGRLVLGLLPELLSTGRLVLGRGLLPLAARLLLLQRLLRYM